MSSLAEAPRILKATHGQTRSFNSRLVLRTIYDQGPISRAEIARATSLTRTSVSDLVAELLEQSLVEESVRGESTGGKPPILVRFVDDARLIVAVDVAETELRGALHDLLDDLIESADRKVLGIGIATPGLVDPAGDTVRRSVHLDWRDLPLGPRLRDRYGLPTHVVNDSHASGLAAFAHEPERLDLAELRALADRGDAVAAGHITSAGRALGASLASLIGALDVERIVLVGPMTALGERWLD